MRKKLIIIAVLALTLLSFTNVWAFSETQGALIKSRCDVIREDLKTLQKNDSRVRVYLGALYERVLTKYMVPLNVRLVENNINNVELIENQNSFAETRIAFVDDFVNYQKSLEELTLMDCKKEPEIFYQELTDVRKKREKMAKNVAKLSELIAKQKELVMKLKETL